MLISDVLIVSICLIDMTVGKVYFEENFDSDTWSNKWVSSNRKRKGVKFGKFVRTAGEFYADVNNTGVAITQKHRFYGLSTEFDEFSNVNKTLVLQYSVKYDQEIALRKGCGGGYIQLFDCGLDSTDLYLDSPYLIKFGPNICGFHDNLKEFLVDLRYKDKVYPINKKIAWKIDVYTHVYTLIIKPDQNYQVLIDGNVVQSGNLEDDWGFIEPKKIKDPNKSKPADWDDRPTIIDPNDVKPIDWDQPEEIPDVNSTKPEDWDEDEYGDWEPDMIPNPKFKGIWKQKQLENPNYHGPWKHPEVKNQYYRPDPNIYICRQICGVGFSFWQGNNGTIFDNVLITDNVAEAEKRRKLIVAGVALERKMWMRTMTDEERKAEAEKKADEARQAEENKKLKAERDARAKKVLAERAARLKKQEEDERKVKLTEGEKTQEQLREKLKLTIIIATSLAITAIIIGVLSTFLIYRYRSKYILSRQEINDFISGAAAPVDRYGSSMAVDGSEKAANMPYNKNKYEISPSSFTIDTTRFLGSGEFGTVCCGSVMRHNNPVPVAVKMINKRGGDMGHGHHLALKGLISEIKILSYVGDHKYILKLEGAYTAKLRRGKVFVFLELCGLGSLDKYLRQCKPVSVTATNENDREGDKKELLAQEMSKDLQIWSLEIATAMEFLASKNIVHADLATRNVLLNAQKCIKIADFGLSRRLYNYTQYQKSECEPLPWRWMAPEALRKLIFTEKTDVWAFGVTLWEMFTLGDEPYPGLSWDVNFATRLERGLCLPEPKYNQGDIYSVMKQCWNKEPSERPTFSELKSSLAGKVSVSI